MCPSSQRPQCVFQVEVPAARSAAATPLTVLPTLLTTRPRQVGTGVELAAKRYGADPRYQARALPRSLPSSGPTLLRPCSHAPRACICFEPCLPCQLVPFARAHAVHVPGLPRRHPAALPNAGQPPQDLLAWLNEQQASQAPGSSGLTVFQSRLSLRSWVFCCLSGEVGTKLFNVSAHASPARGSPSLAFSKTRWWLHLGRRTLLEACLAVATP